MGAEARQQPAERSADFEGVEEAVTDKEKAARVVICVRHVGKTRKLAWFSEYKTGISSGVFGKAKDTDTHWSYHVDGEAHLKSSGKPLLPPGNKATPKATPIGQLTGLTPILSATTIAIRALDRASDDFKPNPKASHIFLSEPSDFSNYTHLSITRFLIDHPSEAESIEKLLGFPPAIIGLVTVPLLHHPSHKLAVLVRADNVGTLDTEKR